MATTPEPSSGHPWLIATGVSIIGALVSWLTGRKKLQAEIEEKLWKRTQEALDARDARIAKLEAKNEVLTARVDDLEAQLDEARSELVLKDREIAALRIERDHAIEKAALHADRIVTLEAEANARKLEIEELEAALSEARRGRGDD